MNAKVEEKEFRLDALKWLVVVSIVIGGAVANSMFSEQFQLIIRVVALVGLGLIALFIAVNTEKGFSFWSLLKAAQIEIRKVVWPSRQEVTQTTLVVVAVVLVSAAILWLIDTGLGFLASKIIG